MEQANRIDKIRAREQAATSGPWTASLCEWECDCCSEDLKNCEDDSPDVCGKGRVITGAFIPQTKTIDWGDYCDMNNNDAVFIAHAREDIPFLLDELAIRDAEIARLTKRIDALQSAIAEDVDFICTVCVHGHSVNGKETCDKGGCTCGLDWQFDEARFSENEE